jgi:hypothetical protein
MAGGMRDTAQSQACGIAVSFFSFFSFSFRKLWLLEVSG